MCPSLELAVAQLLKAVETSEVGMPEFCIMK